MTLWNYLAGKHCCKEAAQPKAAVRWSENGQATVWNEQASGFVAPLTSINRIHNVYLCISTCSFTENRWWSTSWTLNCHVSEVDVFTLWLFNSLPWYSWPIDRWFTYWKMVIFHGELLNNQWIFFVANRCQKKARGTIVAVDATCSVPCLDQTWTKALERRYPAW